MQWELITNIILITSIVILAVFFLLGIYQWIARKSFMKIDPQIRWLPLPFILLAIVWFIFDKIFILNTRPNGSGEPSFPSTHVMVVVTIFFIVMIILPKYVKNKVFRIILNIIMMILISLVSVGRVYANMHYPVDVIGGIAFAFIFSEVYYLVVKRKKKHAKRIHQNHQ